MRLKSKTLSRAITFALVMSANAALGTGLALAQTATDAPATDEEAADDATALETIQVTGSRILSQAVTASSPVMEIQAEQFKFTGATRVEDLVNQYPQLVPTFDSFENNGATGYPTVNLRGLGTSRTLTLIDGFRMPQGANIATDISIVPASLVKRVDILTGGASAVYGSDAVAGVVNFILDTEFEGVSFSAGTSGFRHNNDNSFIQGREAARNFDFPTGDNGFDGVSNNIDMAIGSSFADGKGHAMAWLTWRKNEALFQGERDYSSCALNAAGTSCGGSATNATGNFYVYQPGVFGSSASLNPDGSWQGAYGDPYNYAPINYFQRPDERYSFGSSLKYEVNEHFKPYAELMYINRRSAIQVAESGTFFTPVGLECGDPLVGSLCTDFGIDPADGPLIIYVAKRNIEGGPRNFAQDDENFRIIAGAEGAINDSWSYNASFLYGRNTQTVIGVNDLLTDRIVPALLGCPAGSFDGCLPYNVWEPGGVTAAAANVLAGTSLLNTATSLKQVSAYVTGDTGFGFGSANGENISLVLGTEWREDKFDFIADSNSQAGNFAGSGGPSLPLGGAIRVKELFMESKVPLLADAGMLKSLGLDLGYRWSDYNLAGTTNTYKVGFGADFDKFKVRGGYNRAIRAPNVGNLFSTQQIALFSGTDPCAGATPEFTQAQCANTGVSADRYGSIANNPAGQYNQFVGGNLELSPEKADTWTVGFVVTPIEDLYINVDFYNIEIKDTITSIGAQTILNFCGTTGDPTLCALVQRNPATGDLWRGNSATSGRVVNLTNNFGVATAQGIDLGTNWGTDLLGGRFDVSVNGTYVLKDKLAPLAGVNPDATFDCAGRINISCQTPEWRHIVGLHFARDWYGVNLRWRYFGKLDYEDNKGVPLTVDTLLRDDGKLNAYNYLDLSLSAQIGSFGELTAGVNNLTDKEPPLTGNTVSLNGNSPGGYDQAGRFFFTNFTVTF